MTITNETAIEAAPGAIDQAPRGGLGDLRQIIGQLDAARAELAAAGRRDDLAVGLAQLRTLLADLRILANAVEDDVVALLGDDRAADVAGPDASSASAAPTGGPGTGTCCSRG